VAFTVFLGIILGFILGSCSERFRSKRQAQKDFDKFIAEMAKHYEN
jgi:hypothetical protein